MYVVISYRAAFVIDNNTISILVRQSMVSSNHENSYKTMKVPDGGSVRKAPCALHVIYMLLSLG
jgi:hypothetical protein